MAMRLAQRETGGGLPEEEQEVHLSLQTLDMTLSSCLTLFSITWHILRC